MASDDFKGCTAWGAKLDDEARALEAMREVRRSGGQAWKGPRPASPWVDRHEYEARIRNGCLQYRNGKRRGRWLSRSPTEHCLDDELRKYRAASHRISGQARASAAGVTARQRREEQLGNRVVVEFMRLAERNPPVAVRNRTAKFANIIGISKEHVLNLLNKRGLRQRRARKI